MANWPRGAGDGPRNSTQLLVAANRTFEEASSETAGLRELAAALPPGLKQLSLVAQFLGQLRGRVLPGEAFLLCAEVSSLASAHRDHHAGVAISRSRPPRSFLANRFRPLSFAARATTPVGYGTLIKTRGNNHWRIPRHRPSDCGATGTGRLCGSRELPFQPASRG